MSNPLRYPRIRTAIGHVAFILAATQALQAAPFAYITEMGASNVKVIDTANDTVVANIPVKATPWGVAVNAAGTAVYVTHYLDGAVSVINPATNAVAATINIGGNVTGVAVSTVGNNYVYVANTAGSVGIFDGTTNAFRGSIGVGDASRALVMSPDGTRLYVANASSNSISVIDVNRAHRVAATIRLGSAPAGGMAIDPAGSRLYVTLPNDKSLVVLDTNSRAVVGSLRLGSGPTGIALNPSGTRAYVADWGTGVASGNAVYVIDTASLTVVATVPVGKYPSGISVDPFGTRIYVTNSESDTVSVIDAATNTVAKTIAVGRAPISFGTFIGPDTGGDNYQGLWWKSPAGSESGWGVNLSHQGNVLFGTWFTYDADGSGLWLVMSNGVKTAAGTYSGLLYRTTGPSFDAEPWDRGSVTTTPVGSATFAFTNADNGTFTYTVNGVTQSKPITRQIFSSPAPLCAAFNEADFYEYEGGIHNYQDQWWRAPAESQSGWGLHIAHQGDILFATWFTYGANGKGQWLVMSNGVRSGSDTYSGTLYRTTGPAFDASPWNSAAVLAIPVGTASFSFSDWYNGTFAYTLDGISRSQPITRLFYASPITVCL